jgi:3-dehydroquinate synthase
MSISPAPHTTLTVPLDSRSYPIHIGAGLLSSPALADLFATKIASNQRFALITNDTIAPLYADTLLATLRAQGFNVISVVLPDGEAHKDWQTLNRIFDALLEHAFDRHTTLIALGGGVIGDIVGFAAATYQRGIPFIQIPTTLLAQVDSSVGGKTAVNHPRGKNMIGAFYQPRAVIIDTATLTTLPDREFRSGIAEIIKYGAALDATFFEWLDANMDALVARKPDVLAYAIQRSCEIKAAIVAEDEFERRQDGGRALLNFGHTFGHAIETAMGYGTWLHGEAVACGMVLASDFSASEGLLDMQTATRIRALIARTGLPTTLPSVTSQEMLTHMSRDKKNSGGNIRLILLNTLGQAFMTRDSSASRIAAFLDKQIKNK